MIEALFLLFQIAGDEFAYFLPPPDYSEVPFTENVRFHFQQMLK